ncbi:urate hydroxylase PuuD [Agarilytica rhodophyticola]|uniref:urate hydroxylase PuuD n=1 Tax=Agarilytica rhodophyticola TaxID=1737490 RepID=UPI000B34950E|nr:urate hydroxylase PuuD [Agarilytica rhodophyticola]
MEVFIFEWLNVLLRWLHLITGIAWIGASFYFVWLDNSLETPPEWKKEKGIAGDLWAFHGGGIYEVAKYSLAPQVMPKTLHWFKWEAYSTWITGSLLLIIFYYFQADLYLVGQNPLTNTPSKAIVASLLFLVSGLSVYEILIRSPLVKNTPVFVAVLASFIVFACWLATHIFASRAAFLHVGAMLATIMAANVFIGIIPAQKKFMAAINAGSEPDRAPMLFAKTRSVHNNYFTLPVLFCMISNHYAFIYGHSYNWVLLAVIIATTAYARHFFNLKHRGIIKPHILVVAAIIFISLIGFMTYHKQHAQKQNTLKQQPQATETKSNTSAVSETVSSNETLLALTQQHCTVCHANEPSQAGFSAPPAGLVLEEVDQVLIARDKIRVAVSSKYMPLGNITQMSEKEREQFLLLLDQL